MEHYNNTTKSVQKSMKKEIRHVKDAENIYVNLGDTTLTIQQEEERTFLTKKLSSFCALFATQSTTGAKS